MTNYKHYISFIRVSITIILGRIVTYFDELPPIKPQDPLITCSCEITDYISASIVPIATKLGRMSTYLEELLAMKLLDSLVTWSYEITC